MKILMIGPEIEASVILRILESLFEEEIDNREIFPICAGGETPDLVVLNPGNGLLDLAEEEKKLEPLVLELKRFEDLMACEERILLKRTTVPKEKIFQARKEMRPIKFPPVVLHRGYHGRRKQPKGRRG